MITIQQLSLSLSHANGVKFAKTYHFRGARRCERRVQLCFVVCTIADRFTAEMDMSVQVESEDQEDMVANTPSKRRTRAMRIVDDDDESAGEEEEDEMDEEEEEDAVVVRLPPPVARLMSNHSRSDSLSQMNWSPTRNRKSQSLLPRG